MNAWVVEVRRAMARMENFISYAWFDNLGVNEGEKKLTGCDELASSWMMRSRRM